MTRRSSGEGSIYQRGDGRWCASLLIGTVDGKPQRKVFYGKTKKEATEKLRQARKQVDAGIRIHTDRQTMEQFLTSWLDAVHETVRPTSYITYEVTVRRHLIPAFGRTILAKLTTQQVIAWIKRERESGLAPQTVTRLLVVLKTALNAAQRWRLIAVNPASEVRPPRVPSREVRILNQEQARIFIAVVEQERLGAALTLMLMSGLRHGEALGLYWSDINWQAGIINVQRTLNHIHGKHLLGDPKTARSARRVAVPSMVLTQLQARREAQATERRHAGPSWQVTPLVFTAHDGAPLHQNILLRLLHRVLKQSSLPLLRVHDLRHTYASLLLAQNVHPKIVQEALGHSTISMTMDLYSHALPSAASEAVSRLEVLFGEAE